MPIIITDVVAIDVRYPTSDSLDGSDALNERPDYSAAYMILRTDDPDGLEGHGLTFTTGRGNELCVAAVQALRPKVIGRTLDGIVADFAAFSYELVGDGQLRWVGPEKGSSTSPRPPSSTPSRICTPVRGQATLEAARRHDARRSCASSRSATSPMP